MNSPRKTCFWLNNRSLWRAASVLACIFFAAHAASAGTWTGGSGNWSSDGNPGWNGTGVPNAQGAIATKTATTATVTQDISGGVTVGTLSLGGSSAITWSFVLSNAIILDQDGAGAGVATISNTNTNTGTTNRISLGTGTLTLADDLLLSNTGGSTQTGGSILITSTIGGSGNLIISNVSNNAGAGQISLGGANTFTGNVSIQRGAVTLASTGFGGAGNAVALGSAGNGSATLVTTGSNTALANQITVASGTGGSLVLGSTSTSTVNSSFTGAVTLNGDLTITSSKTGAGTVLFSNVLSGSGSLTKIGAGAATLSGVNTFSGNTVVDDGTLTLTSTGELRLRIQNGNVSNRILGDSLLNLDGTLRLDISTLTDAAGTWNLISVGTLTENYGASFGLAFLGGPAFADAGGGLYTSGNWTFSTATGDLVLAVPEPSAWILVFGGLGLLMGLQRVRMRRY